MASVITRVATKGTFPQVKILAAQAEAGTLGQP